MGIWNGRRLGAIVSALVVAASLTATGVDAASSPTTRSGGLTYVPSLSHVALVSGRDVRLIGIRASSFADVERLAPSGAVAVWEPVGETPTEANRRYGTPYTLIESARRPPLPGVERVAAAPGFWIVSVASSFDAPALARRASVLPGVRRAEPMLAWIGSLRHTPNDPLFNRQWHHRNSGTNFVPDVDANTDVAWDTATGEGVLISVVDSGVEYTHEDLAQNYVSKYSYDPCDGDADPYPFPLGVLESHGTSVAGVAAARGDNGIGVTGAAYRAGFAAQRLLGCGLTDANEAVSLGAHPEVVDISTNSWGPSDNGATVAGPGPATKAAFANAIASGRGGLGTVYTWANGNGRRNGDDGNYDGYTNQRFVVSVGAVADDGTPSPYAETCACMLVAAPSNGGSHGISTTAPSIPGYGITLLGGYTSQFGGTSSAAPLVAGIVALMLDVNQDLSWRDVQALLAATARRDVLAGGDFRTNGAGYDVSHDFGFGLVDAAAAVAAAQTWTPLGPEVTATRTVSGPVTGGSSVTFAVPDDFVVERAELTFDAAYDRRGDVRIELTSPAGTPSVLWPGRPSDSAPGALEDWTTTSVQPFGESSSGAWTLEVVNLGSGAVSVQDATLTLFGHAA